jgi:hypothetical protein
MPLDEGDWSGSWRSRLTPAECKLFFFLISLFLKIKEAYEPILLFVVCINFWIPEPIFMNLGAYNLTPMPISTPAHQSVCLYVYPPLVARQRLGKDVWASTNTRNNMRMVGRVVSYMVRVLSKEIMLLILPIIYCFYVI